MGFPIFIYDTEETPNFFIRAKTVMVHDLSGCNDKSFPAAFPDYLEKTTGNLSYDDMEHLDHIYGYPEKENFIRIITEIYSIETEELAGYAWVYIAHPSIMEYKSLERER